MGRSYEHCGTDGYFGNPDWQRVNWGAIEHPKPEVPQSDFPPASYSGQSKGEETTETTKPDEKAAQPSNREAIIQFATELGFTATVDPVTDVLRFSSINVPQEGSVLPVDDPEVRR